MVLGNELFISDYNKNNYSYRHELTPVELADNRGEEYPVFTRDVNINLTFTDRYKSNRKINC